MKNLFCMPSCKLCLIKKKMSSTSTYLKYSTLLLITMQTSTMVLLLRYSRKNYSGDAYFNSTAVFLSELVKFFICILVTYFKGMLILFVY